MNLYIARHGQTDFNKQGKYQSSTDNELNSTGLRQAEQLGERLKGCSIEAIYSSELSRVRNTAEIISRRVGAKVIVRPELCEINMGEWEQLSQEEVKVQYKEYYEKWSKHLEDLPYPGGECGRDVEIRVMKVVDEIIKSNNRNVLIMTSGGPVRVLLSKFLGLSLEKRFNIDTDNCGLSIVRYEEEKRKFYIKTINDTSHLAELDLQGEKDV